jgi:hypothetical protein
VPGHFQIRQQRLGERVSNTNSSFRIIILNSSLKLDYVTFIYSTVFEKWMQVDIHYVQLESLKEFKSHLLRAFEEIQNCMNSNRYKSHSTWKYKRIESTFNQISKNKFQPRSTWWIVWIWTTFLNSRSSQITFN